MRKLLLASIFLLGAISGRSASILVPMDETQTNHLRAYGIAYGVLAHNGQAQWLLNYRGGSFLFDYTKEDEAACLEKGVRFEVLPEVMSKSILDEIALGKSNMSAVNMQRVPKIAVYAPAVKEVWDDAVISVLQYADIPFDIIYDKEVMQGVLEKYDWLHLHHEDFTGQYGRFYAGFRSAQWYTDDVAASEAAAKDLGFTKVSHLKLAVAKRMKNFIGGGGFLFAMCTATDSYDIALAAEGTDICASMFDGDAADSTAQSKLQFGNCLAFENFRLKTNPNEYEFSTIDTYGTRPMRGVTERNDYFQLNSYMAASDPVLAMLTQNHVTNIKGFWGATAGFDLQYIKKDVTVMGTNALAREARYIHGNYGKGMWTYYSGHDPEHYQHRTGDAPSDLSKSPNSPGYRLILNNILFPSTRSAEESVSAFSAYPNPATTQMNIAYEIPSGAVDAQLSIFDANGKLVSKEQLASDKGTLVIDVSGYAPGNYIWRIESNSGMLHNDKFSVVR